MRIFAAIGCKPLQLAIDLMQGPGSACLPAFSPAAMLYIISYRYSLLVFLPSTSRLNSCRFLSPYDQGLNRSPPTQALSAE